jgi:hypothetical protein
VGLGPEGEVAARGVRISMDGKGGFSTTSSSNASGAA